MYLLLCWDSPKARSEKCSWFPFYSSSSGSKFHFETFLFHCSIFGASLVAQMLKNPPALQQSQVQSLSREHNSLLCSCLENSMDRGAWCLQSRGSQRVRHDWATDTFNFPTSWMPWKFVCADINLDTMMGAGVVCMLEERCAWHWSRSLSWQWMFPKDVHELYPSVVALVWAEGWNWNEHDSCWGWGGDSHRYRNLERNWEHYPEALEPATNTMGLQKEQRCGPHSHKPSG